MKFSRLLFFALIFAVIPLVTAAQESGDYTKAEVIDRIFEEIPFEGSLNERPNDLHQEFSQNPLGLPASQNEKMMEVFLQSFTADTLVHHARNAFQRNYNAEHAAAVMDWFPDEDIQTVLDAEREFYTIQGIRKRVVNRYELEQNPPSDARINLINSLAESMGASEAEIEAQLVLFRAIVSAFGELSAQQSFTESQIDGFVQNYRSQIQMQVNQEVSNQLMLTYHGLDNEALQQYQSFYESEAGNWLRETISESIQSAYRTASDSFLESIRNL